MGWIGQRQRELQRRLQLDLVELAIGRIESLVDRVAVDGARENPLVVAVARGQDVGHVVAVLTEHGAQRERLDTGALTDLDFERFVGAHDRVGGAGIHDADTRPIFHVDIRGLDVPADDHVVLAIGDRAPLMRERGAGRQKKSDECHAAKDAHQARSVEPCHEQDPSYRSSAEFAAPRGGRSRHAPTRPTWAEDPAAYPACAPQAAAHS